MILDRKDLLAKKGELQELKDQREEKRLQIHAIIARCILPLFDPMDVHCEYVDRIKMDEFSAYSKMLRTERKDLDALNKRITHLEKMFDEVTVERD